MSMMLINRGLSQVSYLGAIALVSWLLSLNSSNRLLKQAATSVALAASGAAVATLVQENKLQQAEQVQRKSHQAALKQLREGHEKREASLKTFLDMAMAEAETLKSRIGQMHEVLAADQLEKVAIFRELEALEKEYQHLLYDLREAVVELSQTRTEAQVRITTLESALSQKTEMAAQMLTELEAEATGTFNQFNAKVNSQSELINNLYQQVEELKITNAMLTQQQLARKVESIGAGNLNRHYP